LQVPDLPEVIPLHKSLRSLFCLIAVSLHPPQGDAQQLSKQQTAIVHSIDEGTPAALELLERIVNINSGTFNTAGVIEVGKVFEHEFQTLGFNSRWVPMDAVKRGPSLVAEKKGKRERRLLLIGHMDTVFEPSSPFQKFVRSGDTASGPGIADMKGGLVIILSALKALKTAGVMEDATITVFLTGDEESVGDPSEIARRELVAAAKNSEAVLSFEPEVKQQDKDCAVTARRGSTAWELRVKAQGGHSSQIFTPSIGGGAIFELSRILATFHDTLREPNLTFNVGLVLGGSDAKVQSDGDASVSGKVNIVPGEALALGDIRALYPEQLARTKARMQLISTKSLPGTATQIQFTDKYPPMSPTPGNVALLAKLNEINHALGAPETEANDPMSRGAGDASFVAPFVAVLDGMGPAGVGVHAEGETMNIPSLALQSKRVALLIYGLVQ
jgi:glutamate carboxypeptidase